MATTVYEVLDLELQDGTEVKIKPLDLKRLRRVMKMWDLVTSPTPEVKEGEKAPEKVEIEGVTSDTSILDFLAAASKICLEKEAPKLVADDDKFEEALDLPTMWKLMNVCAGITVQDPNRPGEATVLPGLS